MPKKQAQEAIAHSERAHAKLSASGGERWVNCPGSVALSEQAPPEAPSPYAEEGTKAHECMEFLLANRAKLTSAASIASKKFDKDMVQHAFDFAEYAMAIEKRLEPFCELLIEQKVDYSFIYPDSFGTLDCAIVSPGGELHIIDYKYGAGVTVDVEENLQLLIYAIAAAHQYNYDFEKVILHVVQPRAYHASGNTSRSWETTAEKLIEVRDYLTKRAELVDDPLAPFQAGSWCKWCRAASICPEISSNALKEAKIVFNDDFSDFATPNMGLLSRIPHLGNKLRAAKKLEKWITAIRAQAQISLERGESVDGWKLVNKRETRQWVDPESAALDLELLAGPEADLFFTDPSLKSPAQAEKAIKKVKQANKETLQQWFNTQTKKTSSGHTMVEETDKREAVNPVKDVFTDLI